MKRNCSNSAPKKLRTSIVVGTMLAVAQLLMGPCFARVFPPEVNKASEPYVCQCRCNHQLSACDMFGCGSAIPLREEIQEHLRHGESQQQIIDAFVAKYGQNILSAPPKTAWVTPFAVLCGGLVLVYFVIKAWAQRRPALRVAAPIPSAFRDQMEQELKDLE